MRKYNIIFTVLAMVSIIVLGWFVYYLQNQVETLSQETKSLSSELNDTRQEFSDLNSSLQHSLTLRTFNFTIVLTDTAHSKNTSEYYNWGESAALENVTLGPADDMASTLNLFDLIMGSNPLDVYSLGFPFGKSWVSFVLINSSIMVNTYGYGFYNAVMNTTELGPFENESGTFTVTCYTFTGQVDLLYPAHAGNATFYMVTRLCIAPPLTNKPFNSTETPEAWQKAVPLPFL